MHLTIVYFLCLCAFQLFFFLCFSLLLYLVYFMEFLCQFTCFIILYLIMAIYSYYSAFICDPYTLCLLPLFYGLTGVIFFRSPTK